MESYHEAGDCCRVCRMGYSPDKPLHYPCLCTGSIKYIHQECLVLWLRHSKKEYCELCRHKFTFKPVYSPQMPPSMPLKELLSGLLRNIFQALRFWLHYTLVVVAWLGVVPLTAYRIYKCFFTVSLQSLVVLPTDILSMENILFDVIIGIVVVTVTVSGFIMLLWLREQYNIHGGPDWLTDQDIPPIQIDLIIGNMLVANQGEEVEIENEEEENNEGEDNEVGWNPDAIMEELTWEKFLGIDGSFLFLEHVFWIISLNTSFIFLFVFCPYNVGKVVFRLLNINSHVTSTDLDEVLNLLCGYLLIAFFLIVAYYLLRYTSFKRVRKAIGLCYIILKVLLLLMMEIVAFPLVFGWWLDICSLLLFSITVNDRKENFVNSPGTSIFLHWMAGMLFVFYFAAFVMLLREILRPGVLWFMRNVNDPDFHPVKEMIQQGLLSHLRRLMLSLILFGSTVLISVWLPVQFTKRLNARLIPLNVTINGSSPISEMSLELILLQVLLPVFLEHSQTRKWLKLLVEAWAKVVSYLLDLRSYLIGDVELKNAQPTDVIVYVDNNGRWQTGALPRGTALENNLEKVGSPTVRAYIRTKNFFIKLITFWMCSVLSVIIFAMLTLTIPVTLGRFVVSLVFGDTIIHELYTTAIGFYVLWLFFRSLNFLWACYPSGVNELTRKMRKALHIITKSLITALSLFGVLPLLLGVFFELAVILPLRVSHTETPLLYIWQDWAFGILHLKILCALVMLGPEWWLRDAVERVYRAGFMQIQTVFILKKIVVPVATILLLCICVPYVLIIGVLSTLGLDEDFVALLYRYSYPVCMGITCFVVALYYQGKQLRRLYEKIKNEKYLVGKVLVNYEREQ